MTCTELSLVIPCYNEALNLPLLLKRCAKLGNVPGVEVILVDNGSSDGSDKILEKLLPSYPGCRSVRVEENQGYGYGILCGLRAAKGTHLGWTHADMQTDPQDALIGLELLSANSSDVFVKGSRYGRPFADVALTAGMTIFETLLMRQKLSDINAQPTLFSREFFETWDCPPHDFSLDLYAYYMARQSGLPVRRFPVLFGERAHGISHWNIDWTAKWKFIRRTVEYSLNLRAQIKNKNK